MMILFYKYRLLMAYSLFVFTLFPSICQGSKYSEKVNTKAPVKPVDLDDIPDHLENEAEPFRMKKVNLLWAKGRKMISGPKLAELYADLKLHDREEAVLKKLRADNADKDGKKEAEVLRSYRYIVDEYGLDYKEPLDNDIPMADYKTKSVDFQDPKLQSMWRRAEKSGFSDEDLNTLKEEFWHQQMKVNEFDFMRREMSTDTNDADLDDNIIEVETLKVEMSAEQKKQKMQELKKHNKDIKEGYMHLEHLASTLPKTEPDFKDYRVQKLWALAKKTNWSVVHLESFKEELKHFEHRLSKQDYYQEQLELTRDAYKGQIKEGDEYPEKLLQMKEKTDSVKQKVKKLHDHMKKKLEKALRHTEL